MNRTVNDIFTRKAAQAAETAKEAAANIKRFADEEVIVSRKMISLKIVAAFLGGLVIGMLISPRKKVSYKIASDNHDIGEIPGLDYDGDDDYDEDEEDDDKKNSKFIKL